MNLCIICMNESKLKKLNGCTHSFCESCIQQWFDVHKHDTCPMCRCVLSTKDAPRVTTQAHKNRRTFFSDDAHLSYLAELIGAI